MHALPDAELFTVADARAFGWSESALRRAHRSGRLIRVRHGYYAATAPGPVQAAIAASQACRHSVISHRSAGLTTAVPILGRHDFRPELTISPPSTGDVVGALLHRATLRPDDVIFVEGNPVTSPARTAIDLGRSMPLTTAVVAIDHILHHGLASREDLADVLEFCRNWPGIKRAVRAVALADARTESPLESVSRLAIVRLRLPSPEPQVTIVDRYGREAGRLDFYWDEAGVGGEADGMSKYADEDGRAVLNLEKDRHEAIEDLRVELARWQWRHTAHPALMRTKIENSFERGRLRDQAGIARLWTPRPSPMAR